MAPKKPTKGPGASLLAPNATIAGRRAAKIWKVEERVPERPQTPTAFGGVGGPNCICAITARNNWRTILGPSPEPANHKRHSRPTKKKRRAGKKGKVTKVQASPDKKDQDRYEGQEKRTKGHDRHKA